MKAIRRLIFGLVAILLLVSCDENDETLRESTYLLHRVGTTPINGAVTFVELDEGQVRVDIVLENTVDGIPFPAHLHFGDIGVTGELAFRLNDVDGATGLSTTILDQVELTSGEQFDFDFLQEMNGSVKIHLNDSFFRNIAIAAGNIGTNRNSVTAGIAVCTGH